LIPAREGTPVGDLHPPRPETLRALYDRYCHTEVRELLHLLPRAGLRTLWRRVEARAGEDAGGMDSIERLERECRALLPLPPYETWLGLYLANRRPFLERMGVPAAPGRPDPVTVAVRPMGRSRWAHLNLFVRDVGWRGYVAFHGPDPLRTHRTADIFHADDPDEIRERFAELSRSSLEAFLRSAGG
jgi:hypothetical protein